MDQPWTGVTIFNIVDIESIEYQTNHVEDLLQLEDQQGLCCDCFFNQDDLDAVQQESGALTSLIASAAKRQRAEVKVRDLGPDEIKQFQKAKDKEPDQWLATETVRKVLRSQIPEKNILRAQWVLTWKERDAIASAARAVRKKPRPV